MVATQKILLHLLTWSQEMVGRELSARSPQGHLSDSGLTSYQLRQSKVLPRTSASTCRDKVNADSEAKRAD